MSRKRVISFCVPLALALGFALVFYAFTTPLGPSIGSDNAIYMTMGTALANGYAPYTEIFDHKGPLVFILQAIPQVLSGGYSTTALFAQQVVFLLACLLLLSRIAGELHAPAVIVQLVYLALISSLTGGGNLTEEYSNVFTLLGLLVILRAFGGGLPGEPRGLFARACLLGAMAMLCFLTRANNALVLCAMTLALALCLLARRAYAQLARGAGGFVCGMALSALPVALWLLSEGALAESFYGAIVHNMMYAETQGASRLQMLLHSGYGRAALLMAALSCAGALTFARRSPALALSMIAGAAAAGAAAFVSHKFYDHYLIIGAPLAAMGAACVLGRAAKRSRKLCLAAACAALAVCLCWLGVKGAQTNSWRLAEREGLEQFTLDAQALYAQVPEEDRDSFMAYRVEPRWYVAAGALPCMRFYFLQETLADADPAVMDEIVSAFETDPPRYIVLYYNRSFSPPYDERVQEIFAARYEFVDAKGQYQLLKLKENA